MIAFLCGTIAGLTPQAAYIEVGGVGYRVLMSQLALSKLPEVGSPVRVLTYLQVSESGLVLYGFLREDERALFESLIGVSGVGPKVALAALSTYAPGDFAGLIAAQDVSAVQKIPGVGKKTASRIVLELKGSLDLGASPLFDSSDGAVLSGVDVGVQVVPASPADSFRDIAQALMGMGFSPSEVDLALEGAPSGAAESEVLQHALRRLGSR